MSNAKDPKTGKRVLIAEQEAARARALERMKTGLPIGVGKFNRDEIYDERLDELDARRRRHLQTDKTG
jgi:hypothetical protein